MNTCEASVTIYNHKYNRVSKADEWRGTRITGVSWYGGQKAAVGDNGLNTADAYTVRIPENAMPEGYVTPEAYNAAADVSGMWTVQSGDIVAYGLLNVEIAKTGDITGHYRAFIVTGVSDNRGGAISVLKHLKVEGK